MQEAIVKAANNAGSGGTTTVDGTVVLSASLTSNFLDTSTPTKTVTSTNVSFDTEPHLGTVGSAVFNGTGYVLYTDPVGATSDFVLASDFKISCWFTTTAANSSGYRTLFNLGFYTGDEIMVQRNNVFIKGVQLTGNFFGITLTNDQWYYLEVNRIDGVIRFFVDGVMVYSVANAVAINTANNPMMIGGSNHSGGGENWDGKIKNVLIENLISATPVVQVPSVIF